MTHTINKDSINYFPFWVLTTGVFIIAILPSLVQDGMFIDGIQYAIVSKNLANGPGTFWFPFISQNWDTMGSNVFLENPPLVYAIQGFFFRIFGDGLYTERIYCLFTAIFNAFLIVSIWRLVTRSNKEIQRLSWLPVLFWLSMPIVFRSFQMNVSENTMGLFILSSVFFILKGLANNKHSYLYIFLGGTFIFLSTLCKGITGLFPLATVGLFWLAGGKIRFPKVIFLSLVLLLLPVLLYVLILLNDQAHESFSFYYQSRLIERINNDPVVNSHFHIIFRLFIDLLPAIILSAVVFMIQRKEVNFSQFQSEKTHMVFFLLMGLAGSLPLALTLVQRDHYLGLSLPFFALAFALFVSVFLVNAILQFTQKAHIFRLFKIFSVTLLIAGFIYTGLMIGKTGRDHDILNDTYLIGEVVEEGSRVHLGAIEKDHWRLELYLLRYFNVSLGEEIEDTEYYIQGPEGAEPDKDIFELVPLNTETYKLYQRMGA